MEDLILNKKWEKVKEHYERAYRIKFRNEIPRHKIEELYREMQKLYRCEEDYSKKSS